MVRRIRELVVRYTKLPWLLLLMASFWIAVWLTYGHKYCIKENAQLVEYTASDTTKDLIVFSYMRSGSSLTGELLGDSPGTFYMFEPLISLAPYHYFTKNAVCKMRDTSCSTVNGTKRVTQALETLQNLFTCRIRDVPKIVIDDIIKQNKSGHAWYKLGQCLNGKTEKSANTKITELCYQEIEQGCITAGTRIAKILRLGFINIEPLIQKLPRLNVLFLTRDPRAIINSRIKTDWFPVIEGDSEVVQNNIVSLCIKMEEDSRVLAKLTRRHEGRILKMKIEDVTSSETEMLNLFKFINKNVSNTDEARITNIMIRKRENRLFRDWTKDLKTEYRRQIEIKCQHVIKIEEKINQKKC